MLSEEIYCKECDSKKREIEENGAFDVVSCDQLPDQENVPEDQRRCKIIWELKGI